MLDSSFCFKWSVSSNWCHKLRVLSVTGKQGHRLRRDRNDLHRSDLEERKQRRSTDQRCASKELSVGRPNFSFSTRAGD